MLTQSSHRAFLRQSLLLLACVFITLDFVAQAPPPATPLPSFDVASIKSVDPNAPLKMFGIQRTPDGIHAQRVTLKMLMRNAWGQLKFMQADQITGIPDWAKDQFFNVEARVSQADAAALKTLTPEERDRTLSLMLQALLAERFELKLHTGSKQVAAYDLVVVKSGFKQQSDPGAPTSDARPSPIGSTAQIQLGKSDLRHTTLAEFATFLSNSGARELGRPVVDKTGLSGAYTFSLEWSPVVNTSSPDSVSIFTALQAVGLSLRPSTATVETLIIDHVARPTAD